MVSHYSMEGIIIRLRKEVLWSLPKRKLKNNNIVKCTFPVFSGGRIFKTVFVIIHQLYKIEY